MSAGAVTRGGAGVGLLPIAAMLGISCGVTVLLVTVFNFMAQPIAAELGLSRAATSGALSLHLAVLIVALPVAGVIVDRVGPRRVTIVSALCFAAALLWIARIGPSRWELYAAFAAAGVAGAGASPISYARAIVAGYAGRRGLALGIALSGTGLGGIVLPLLVRPVVIGHGWRAGFVVLAVLAGTVGVVAGLLAGDSRQGPARTAADGCTLRQAAATSAFWLTVAAFALLAVALSGFIAHLTEIWQARGIDPAGVPAFQAAIGIATIVGRLGGGALMDVVPAKFVGAGAAAVGAAGLALFGLAAGSPLVLLAVAVAIGLCTGTESDVVSYLASRYYGLRSFARIYAVQGAFFMAGFALGPVLAAIAFGAFGTDAAVGAGAACLAASALLLALLRTPERTSDAGR